jgi:hypothetical protein
LFDVGHRARAFFRGYTLPFGTCEAYWGGVLPADHPRTIFIKQCPLNPVIERATSPFQYIRENGANA